MNSRGAVELVIALLALNYGLLTQPVFVLVAMAIITTLVFPLFCNVKSKTIHQRARSNGLN